MKKMIGLLAVILCCVGVYKIVQMPAPLSNAFRGAYTYDAPSEGVFNPIYVSVEDRDFHIFHQMAGLYLYGTYEEVGESTYLMKGVHIEEQTVVFDTEEKKFSICLNDGEIPFKKISDTPMVVSDSLEKAKANDRKTAEQLEFLPDLDLYGGTYGYVDGEGNLSKEEPYRFAADEEKNVFWLYNEKTGYFTEGESKTIAPHAHYVLTGEEIGEQHIYPQESGIVMELNGKDFVFVKLDDEIILPDSEPAKKIR